jgi:hypothetical protein
MADSIDNGREQGISDISMEDIIKNCAELGWP